MEKIYKEINRCILMKTINDYMNYLSYKLSKSPSAPPYLIYLYNLIPPSEEKYKHEINLLKKGDKLIHRHFYEGGRYYEKAMKSIKEKQDKIGEGKDINLDYMRVYTVYAMARTFSRPEYAEKYLLEAKNLAEKYSKIWKEPLFIEARAITTETPGFIYFTVVEWVRKDIISIILFEKPLLEDPLTDGIVMEKDDAEQFSKFYNCREIITAKNFTKILHYYKIAKKYYEEYLKYYEENAKVLENSPYSEFYREKNKVVLSHLKIIDEVLHANQSI
jgi:hypothetical protein